MCKTLLLLIFMSGVISQQYKIIYTIKIHNQSSKVNLIGVTHLGQNPTGGDQLSAIGDNQYDYFCCCSSYSSCPQGYNNDYYKATNQNTPSSSCPNGKPRCCYKNIQTLRNFLDFCTTYNEEESFKQYCPANIPIGIENNCGTRSFTHAPHRVHGQSSPEEFPWTCLILTLRDEFVGSCVIIPEKFDNQIQFNTRKVLTAAHIIQNLDYNDLKIRVLDNDARGFYIPEKRLHEEYSVHSSNIHPYYNGTQRFNDIAILKTNRFINLQRPGVNAACLPSCSNMFEHVFQNGTGARCWVAGWGKDKVSGSFSAIQKKVNVPLVPWRKCEAQLKQAIQGRSKIEAYRLHLDDSEICAGGESGEDPCDGLDGSPLVCQSVEGRWHVLGIVTWGIGCTNKNVPRVYTKVSSHKNWLESV